MTALQRTEVLTMAKRNTFFEDEKIEKKIDIKQLGRTVKYILPEKKTKYRLFIL